MNQYLALRRQTGLTQKEFAKVVGASVETLKCWELGRHQPSAKFKTKLGKIEKIYRRC